MKKFFKTTMLFSSIAVSSLLFGSLNIFDNVTSLATKEVTEFKYEIIDNAIPKEEKKVERNSDIKLYGNEKILSTIDVTKFGASYEYVKSLPGSDDITIVATSSNITKSEEENIYKISSIFSSTDNDEWNLLLNSQLEDYEFSDLTYDNKKVETYVHPPTSQAKTTGMVFMTIAILIIIGGGIYGGIKMLKKYKQVE